MAISEKVFPNGTKSSYDYYPGGFTSEDRVRGIVVIPETLNHYQYCWNNPNKFVDQNGKFPALPHKY